MDGFFPQGSFFVAVAFTSGLRRGNPTGVVFAHPEWSERTCQRLAAELGFPDTAFLTPGPNGWTARFFSPSQPLALCVQAVLACGAVLAPRGEELALLTETGEVGVHGEEGQRWARFPKARVRALDMEPPAGVSLPGADGRVVDSGRVRLYRELADRAALEALTLAPAEVMAVCARTGLQGLCFWTRIGAEAVALRVFTPSLEGGEDASTGGAVLGLSALLPPGTWQVAQGVGPFHRTGELWLRSKAADVEVGGAVKVVASGMVADV